MYIMYTGRDAETKRTNMLTHTHTREHTLPKKNKKKTLHTQTCTVESLCGSEFISVCLPLRINTPVGRQTAVSVPGRLPKHTHTYTHPHTHAHMHTLMPVDV